MPWKIDLVIMMRSLIGDLDKDTYTDDRLRQLIVIGAYNVIGDTADTTYTVSIGGVTISPDPITEGDYDFAALMIYNAACILLSGEVKSDSGCAISVRDGVSTIDMKGAVDILHKLQKDICAKYQAMLTQYKAGNSINGVAVLTPYSPGSEYTSRHTDHRSGDRF